MLEVRPKFVGVQIWDLEIFIKDLEVSKLEILFYIRPGRLSPISTGNRSNGYRGPENGRGGAAAYGVSMHHSHLFDRLWRRL